MPGDGNSSSMLSLGGSVVHVDQYCHLLASWPLPADDEATQAAFAKYLPNYEGHLSAAKGHAENWLGELRDQIVDLVSDVKFQTTKLTDAQTEAEIDAALQLLQANWEDKTAQRTIRTVLKDLYDALSPVGPQVSDLVSTFDVFHGQIKSDIDRLEEDRKAYQGLTAAEQALQDKISSLNSDVEAARTELHSQIGLTVVEGVIAAAALTVAIIICVTAPEAAATEAAAAAGAAEGAAGAGMSAAGAFSVAGGSGLAALFTAPGLKAAHDRVNDLEQQLDDAEAQDASEKLVLSVTANLGGKFSSLHALAAQVLGELQNLGKQLEKLPVDIQTVLADCFDAGGSDSYNKLNLAIQELRQDVGTLVTHSQVVLDMLTNLTAETVAHSQLTTITVNGEELAA